MEREQHSYYSDRRCKEIDSNLKFLTLQNSGFMYIYGRDLKYRPIIVLNPGVLERLKPSLEQLLNAVTFILEYLKRNMLLPGQIENWVIVCDIAKLSISKIPKSVSSLC